jgi:hypothetical protein
MSKWLAHVKATIKKEPGIMKNGGLKEILKVASATYKKEGAGTSDCKPCKPCKGTKKRHRKGKGKRSAKGGKRSAKGGTKSKRSKKRKSRKH